ncbi:anti-sigma B factor antagonist [Rhodothermaceae bacterium RA]|nr:anti-sigma B factor antagonist [Rhodothermaceae bacterium RA]
MHNPKETPLTTPVMSFTVEPCNDETVIVHVGKALDFRNAADFKAVCLEQVQAGIRNFVLDFSDTGILDSTGLGSIFSLYRQVSPLKGQVVFAAVSRPVQVVVQLTRTYKVFRQFPTVDAARDAL